MAEEGRERKWRLEARKVCAQRKREARMLARLALLGASRLSSNNDHHIPTPVAWSSFIALLYQLVRRYSPLWA